MPAAAGRPRVARASTVWPRKPPSAVTLTAGMPFVASTSALSPSPRSVKVTSGAASVPRTLGLAGHGAAQPAVAGETVDERHREALQVDGEVEVAVAERHAAARLGGEPAARGHPGVEPEPAVARRALGRERDRRQAGAAGDRRGDFARGEVEAHVGRCAAAR